MVKTQRGSVVAISKPEDMVMLFEEDRCGRVIRHLVPRGELERATAIKALAVKVREVMVLHYRVG